MGKGDHSLALFGAVLKALRADAAVSAHVGARIHDDVPERVVWPYLTLTDGGSFAAFGSSDYEADDFAFDVHVWSRHINKTSSECRLICSAVQAALHDAELDLGAGASLARLSRARRMIFRDPDNITWHGVVSFEGRVETMEA
ncbi:DUF3168 domain-containing protein [Neomegalonema sp.]|uniref:DUF3168 domain-containing protein n=1 Tax=Neomegalonema sp. TaxID=2039713 RepID=UPI0026359135|nr:DUF3168 domain-containing protein [Neomegalonema sp.]MDD2870325.1 DUF3168 domain-containing protein [Neomegalonema sp.]